ncbi:MerR family transcriptional regulator [Bacillus testis]|uniref:MerR family transcriptional regulator n=1 Tax=Bacillus testis TaxID=1622072 RepID=UPI0008410E40|nr:MerR family transcriptional regulator [Bacillus testis]
MVEKHEKLLTIGEISKMTNLPIRTFHYYDEIGVFKPVYIDKKTKYRYYSESQLYSLDLIKSLKFIGTSLEDIKYAQSLTPEQLVDFLAKQEQLVKRKVKQIQEVHYTLLKTKKHLEEQISIPVYEEVYEMDMATQRILAIKTTDATILYTPEKYFRPLAETLEREGSVMNSHYGGIYPLKQYDTINDFYYNYLFTPLLTERYLEKLAPDVEVLKIPAGRYACIAFVFSEDLYIAAYKKLYAYVNHLNLGANANVFEVYMPTWNGNTKLDTFFKVCFFKLNGT